jgi:hypothetical protein
MSRPHTISTREAVKAFNKSGALMEQLNYQSLLPKQQEGLKKSIE